MNIISKILFLLLLFTSSVFSQSTWIDKYNIEWTTQSENSMQSMPCGGAGIGLNVWVENNQIFILLGSADSWLETPLREKPFEYVMRKMAKLGRLRISLSDGVFSNSFSQKTDLSSNSIIIEGTNNKGSKTKLRIWSDFNDPIVHIQCASDEPVSAQAQVEYWRGKALLDNNAIEWGYRNDNPSLNSREFYIKSRGLEDFADKIPDLFSGLTFGGRLEGDNFIIGGSTNSTYQGQKYEGLSLKTLKADTNFNLQLSLRVSKEASYDDFFNELKELSDKKKNTISDDWNNTCDAWKSRWNKSYIRINEERGSEDIGWQVGRNYQLFRAMLAANNKGKYPTLFNGGMFTCLSDPESRRWDWSEYMAQNQRLVYWPMLRTGDIDLLEIALNFYKERTSVSEAWAKHFWSIKGHFYPEDMGVFGLPDYPNTKDGFSVPDCLTYHFTSGMEFALMMLEAHRYFSVDIKPYLNSIIGILQAFDEFYRKENIKRTGQPLDQNNKYVLYPGNGVELYTQTRNESATIAGLMALSDGLLALEASDIDEHLILFIKDFRMRLPQIPRRVIREHETIAPAESWEKERADTNMEFPHLYPLFPFGIYSIGRPDFQLALDTWKYGYFKEEYQRRAFCWYQGGIFTARLGMANDAREYAIAKFLYPLKQEYNGEGKGFETDLTPRRSRYPAFWDTGSFCELPDMDHGGSAMIGLQEMLLQSELPGVDGYGNKYGKQIYLLPAWPKDWDVDFKLYAPYNTIVECSYKNGKIKKLKVTPKERLKDVKLMMK